MKTRLIAGFSGLAIILPLLFLGPPICVELLVMAATGVALWEFAGIALPGRQKLAFAALGPAGLAVQMAIVWGADASVLPTLAVSTLGCLLFGLFVVDETEEGATAATRMVMGLLYISVLFSFLSQVRHLNDGVTWVFVSMLLAWLGDTGAYFAGKAFGNRKLFPRISPKKTWEGAIGGAIAVVAGMAVVKLVAVPHMGWGHVIALGLLGDVAGVVGDLVESLIKRAAKVKDAGSFLPGHGGILDRIDSLLFTAPLTYLYVTITGLGVRPGPLAALTVGLALVRLWLSARTGLGDDEAYYWHWSTALDLSYREHPPLVAWVIAAGCRVAGENPLGVRLGFVLSGLWASYLTWSVAETEQPGTGWLASLLVSLVPMFAIMAVFAAPDMPMLCGWLLAWRGLQRDRWLWMGLGMGLALLGKLTGGLLVVGVLLAVVRRRPDQLRHWGLWAALGLVLLMNLPSLWWALDHGGGTFTYQLVERHRHRVLPWVGAGQLVGSQLLLVGPAVVAMLAALRQPGMHRELALPTLVLFSLAALVTDSKIHWLAPSWLLLAPGAAAWLAPRPRWTAVSLGTAGLLTALVYTQSQVSVVPLDSRADPTVEMRGWHDVAAHAVEMRDQCGIPDAPIAGHMYQTTGQLRWAVPRDIPVVRAGTRPDQYATWQTAGPYVGGPAVFVAPERYRVSPLKEGFFDTCEATEEHRFNGRLFLVTCCKGCAPMVSTAAPPEQCRLSSSRP